MLQWTDNQANSPQTLAGGCRCIEIDVWDGDDVVSTTQKSTSDHRRGLSGISGSSIPYLAHHVADSVGDAMESLAGRGGDRSLSRTRSNRSAASGTSRALTDDHTPESSINLQVDPKESNDRLDVSSITRSRSHQLFNGEPIVTHGWTWMAPCGFREVCVAVRESAFVTNDLPIIVSLEVHAGTEQQKLMVKIMKEEWGDMLVSQEFEGCDPRFRVPTLDEARNRIFVKAKRAAHNRMSSAANTFELKPPRAATQPDPQMDDGSSSDEDDSSPPPLQRVNKSEPIKAGSSPKPSGKRAPICPELSELAVYTRSERFKGFATPQAKRPAHIFSIQESKILELYKESPYDVFKHNKNCFMRAFPDGRRFDSSNPDPSLFWRKGVQMIAMNWQYTDEGMMLNEGMFDGENGWVLKPPGYHNSNKETETHDDAAEGQTMDLSITLFAAQNVPVNGGNSGGSRDDLRPCVKVELHAEKAAASKKDGGLPENIIKQKTETGKGANPRFGQQGTKIDFLKVPKVVQELSFIRFKVEDDPRGLGIGSSTTLAWACIRLDRLSEGYRFINLRDMKNNPIEDGKILVRIAKTFK